MAKLFIVESPGKIKTLRKILGPGWILEASVGHTTELAQDGHKRLGFDFQGERVLTRYQPRGPRGKQVLSKLRKAVRESEIVYLATDPDREGEAIAWHLVEQLRIKKYVRVAYTQITEAAVKKAIAHPLPLNQDLIQAQRARQCLDKLVGFEVSPLLWNSTGGKSAGRVQSATLHLICERERERLAFKPENYWVLKSRYAEGFEAVFERMSAPGLQVREAQLAGDADLRVKSEAEAKLIAEVAKSSPHIIQSTEQKRESRNAPPPLITSSLQQVAGARYRYSPKQTMQIAQELYEGIGGKGLITYMRTDAVSLSPEFVAEARAWLKENAPDALPERPPFYRTQSEAQGAHEAIRPTSAAFTPDEAQRKLGLSKEQANVYRLIWERAIASQCKPAQLSRSKITVACAETLWVARGTTVLEEGYLKFWKNLEEETHLPQVKEGQILQLKEVVIEAKTTQPPSRYSEPKLVQLMEKKGIGRPSTYASTLATLKDRDYVVLDKSLLAPTALGMATDEALTRAIPELVDSTFTALMERSLDEIAEGKLAWERYLIEWNRGYLEPALIKAREALRSVARVAPERNGRRGARPKWGKSRAEPKAKRTRTRAHRTPAKPSVSRSRPTGVSAGGAFVPRGEDGSPIQATSLNFSLKAFESPPVELSSLPNQELSSLPKANYDDHVSPELNSVMEQARAHGSLPVCPQGHGALAPRVSKKGATYWKCAKSGCESFAWHQEYTDQKCPDCGSAMEKISSAKVTGGFFVKCGRIKVHESQGEIVMFKSRRTGEWEKSRR
jgi:DNA topoisomerase-1